MFNEKKHSLKLLDRTESLEKRIEDLHSQNLSLIKLVEELKNEIAWLKYQNFIDKAH
jgi:hypothetical protein